MKSDVSAVGSVVADFIENVLAVLGAGGLYKLATAFAEIHRTKGPNASERNKRAQAQICEYRRDRRPPDASVAWDLFEACARAGTNYSSGFLGIVYCGHPGDVLGVLWCMRMVDHKDAFYLDRLQELTLNAPLATGNPLYTGDTWPDIDLPDAALSSDSLVVARARETCILDAAIRDEFAAAWQLWKALPHNATELSRRYRGFPTHTFLVVSDSNIRLADRFLTILQDTFWFT
ncbi:MAG TPA: hypothetical protein VMF11_04445 [Candidatus Baltobacteraceae bacterium]|nr:hypothetical protein [Candidatus Baltobacteraceae bacterium]